VLTKEEKRTLCERLRRERIVHCKSQSEMAEIMDVSERQYANYEAGKSLFSLDGLISAKEKAGFDMHYIIHGQLTIDYNIEMGFSYLPIDQYLMYHEKLRMLHNKLADKDGDKKDIFDEISRTYNEIVIYGQSVNDPMAPRREVVPFRVFTEIYEACLYIRELLYGQHLIFTILVVEKYIYLFRN